MELIFAGVGEAFDEEMLNTTILVLTGNGQGGRQILLDCGFTGAHAFWRVSPKPMALDAVYVSHFHGDHFFGLPVLLLRFWDRGRERPLSIIGQDGIQDKVVAALDLAYPNFRSKLQYPIQFEVISPGKDLHAFDCHMAFAETAHSASCLAIRLDHEGKSVFYSGDGSPTEDTLALARGCDVVVHEAFGFHEAPAGHGQVDWCVDFARTARAKALALVHMGRDTRRKNGEDVKKALSEVTCLKAFLPEPGEHYRI